MIRLLGVLMFASVIALAACSGGDDDTDSNGNDNPFAAPTTLSDTSDAGGNGNNSGNCDEIGANIVTGEDAIPAVEGEVREIGGCLKVIDVVVGDGDEAPADGRVTVHYTGYLEDGTVFDSSVTRGQPFATSLNRVIQGWTEGIPGMRIGGQRRLIIPPEMAYGEAGSGAVIPPNATLIFDVELLEIIR